MRGPKPRYPIRLLENEIRTLGQWIQAQNSPQVKGMRARIVLIAHEHAEWSNQQIAAAVECTDPACRKGGGAETNHKSGTCLGQERAGVFPRKCARK